jgi:hypothetical protein
MLFNKIIFSGYLIILSGISLNAQDTSLFNSRENPDDEFIRWVSQYPSLNEENNAKPKDRIVDFLFGSTQNKALIQPLAVMAFSLMDYYILDQENGTILRVKDELGEMTHFHNETFKNFISLVGICRLPYEKILFTDSYYNKVFYFTPGKKNLGVLNDSMTFDRPTGVAYSPVNQEIWVVETNAHRLTILDENGNLIRRIGGRGTSPGEFNYPTSIWIDNSGKVFIVDAMNFRIQVFSSDGNVLSVFGKPGDATGYFARPKGIATDSQGNIYVADALYNTVQIFDMRGNFLYNFGSQGHGEGEFWMPSGIYIDEQDYIYVADTYNARVQIFQFIKGKQ